MFRPSRPAPLHLCRVSGRSCPLNGVGPVRTRRRISTSQSLSMRVSPIGLEQYVRIGPLSRKRASTTPMISFFKNIATKGRRALCQPPRPAATSVALEFYADLASHVVKKVRVRGVLVDFSTESINQFYNLDPIPPEPFERLYERPEYPEVIRVLTNGRGEWNHNNEGHAVHFKAKNLAYIPKV